nr:AAA family ATPase [Faecalibaculum rodentium]
MIIARPDYLNRIKAFQGRSLIKVLTGMRRVGKSTLLKQIQESLLNEGVKESQIIQINMEEMENEPLTDYHRLYEHIQRRLQKDQMNYIFIDEVQEVDQFEKVLNSLQAKDCRYFRYWFQLTNAVRGTGYAAFRQICGNPGLSFFL